MRLALTCEVAAVQLSITLCDRVILPSVSTVVPSSFGFGGEQVDTGDYCRLGCAKDKGRCDEHNNFCNNALHFGFLDLFIVKERVCKECGGM